MRLNVEARADLEWWYQFGLEWNGTAMMRSVAEMVPQVELVSDASGSWGCGAVWTRRWFQLSWDQVENVKAWNIMPKELLPIVIVAMVWGSEWRGLTVKARCDNMAVVATIKSGTCKERNAMWLMRYLAFIEATKGVTVVAEHIKGVDNVVADVLSRNKCDLARSIMQVADEVATPVPEEIVTMLTEETPYWSEQEWQRMRTSCLTKD